MLLPHAGAAQGVVRASVEENFRREPQGQVLGRVNPGTELARVAIQGSWSQATLEGWVWTASLQTTTRDGMDLVVAESGGENLRAEPSGTILARLDEGTLLEEVERRPGWTRVRRTGWIWSPSVVVASGSTAPEPSGAPGPSGTPSAGTTADAAAPMGAQAPTGGARSAFMRPRAGQPILSAPDGDTLGVSSGDGDVQVLAREGSWVRVRMEGWVWSPAASEVDEDAASTEGAAAALTPDALSGPDGDRYEGQRVSWVVQFISLERAEAVRTDFYEGEPFILGRVGGGDGDFVYIAVPPDRLASVQGLTPLEMISVTGRVRRAVSALTGTPILDLLALERGAGR